MILKVEWPKNVVSQEAPGIYGNQWLINIW